MSPEEKKSWFIHECSNDGNRGYKNLSAVLLRRLRSWLFHSLFQVVIFYLRTKNFNKGPWFQDNFTRIYLLKNKMGILVFDGYKDWRWTSIMNSLVVVGSEVQSFLFGIFRINILVIIYGIICLFMCWCNRNIRRKTYSF